MSCLRVWNWRREKILREGRPPHAFEQYFVETFRARSGDPEKGLATKKNKGYPCSPLVDKCDTFITTTSFSSSSCSRQLRFCFLREVRNQLSKNTCLKLGGGDERFHRLVTQMTGFHLCDYSFLPDIAWVISSTLNNSCYGSHSL